MAADDWNLVLSLELPSFGERAMPWAGALSKGQGGQSTWYLELVHEVQAPLGTDPDNS